MSIQPICGRMPNNAPVFAYGFDDADEGWEWTPDDGLPNVCTSIPAQRPTENLTGRLCKGCYKPSMDPNGEMALFCGTKFFNEGIGYTDEVDGLIRIECFCAAELLFLHATEKGSPRAFLSLGHLYAYNRCEGNYWGHWESLSFTNNAYERCVPEDMPPYPYERRALECYLTAAEAGIAEAYCYVGDLIHDGFGCEPSSETALSCYRLAYEHGVDDEPLAWGNAALRIGHCYEEGDGCDQSFEEAAVWYGRAVAGLDEAVQDGYRSQASRLRRAKDGFARVRQELNGKY